ncbi:hypothetical protein [uncultured Chitinophaga sp.]|jgi:hypothetical protein|uniref:hypothetical protein n=1 Tax=uncultured Chitinophaga sp. TaxID=339340 RepID=UPI0026121758|nr:hypothetical protein [uncultured Chitinophaga sp.]
MKVLKLHPLMTISLLQMQFQRLLCCNVMVYVKNKPASAFDTLRETGFAGDGLIAYPIDETLSLREFEAELEDHFNVSLELCGKRDNKPFMNKSLHLYQVSAMGAAYEHSTREEGSTPLEITLEMLLNSRQTPPGFSF